MGKSFMSALTILSFLGVLTLFYFQTRQKDKIAYVDNGKILSDYYETKVVKEELDAKTKLWSANVDTLLSELQNGIKDYEKNRATMSDREKKTNEELLNNKKNQYEQYKYSIDTQTKDASSKAFSQLSQKINAFITDYGKKHNYKFILGANESGNIVYANEYDNITNEIVEGLNAQGKNEN